MSAYQRRAARHFDLRPLRAQAEILGVFHLRTATDAASQRFEALHRQIVSVVADRVALALANLTLRERLRQESTHDPLTDLFNRRYIIKPSAPTAAFAPEPALDETVYREILKICLDTGVEMERHPSIYQGKDEETLRDHFLMVLAPHFHSVTGETFNKSGKTDILIRHERANVFVAECKYWAVFRCFMTRLIKR